MKIESFDMFNERFLADMILSKVDSIIKKLHKSTDVKIYGSHMYSSESDYSYGFTLEDDKVVIYRIPQENKQFSYKVKINGKEKEVSNTKAERLFHEADDMYKKQH